MILLAAYIVVVQSWSVKQSVAKDLVDGGSEVVELVPSPTPAVSIATSENMISDVFSSYVVLEQVSEDPIYYRELSSLLEQDYACYEGTGSTSDVLLIPVVRNKLVSANAVVDAVSQNSSSENVVSANTVSENVVSQNTVSENAVSENVVSSNSASKNAASSNSASKNFVIKDKNPVSIGSASHNSVPVEWDGSVLSKKKGVNQGPSGKETYYNLPMDGIVKMMRGMGNNDEHWIREDGVHMLGDYVMVAANLSVHPRGSYVETSLGIGVVTDTGGFAEHNPTQLDIATVW